MLKSAGRWLFVLALSIVGMATFSPAADAAFPGANGPIAYSLTEGSTTDVFTIQPDGTGKAQVTNGPTGFNNHDAAFSNGSEKIVYARQNRDLGPGNGRIHVVNADGTGDVTLTPDNEWDDQPSFSPDGSKIIFVKHGDGLAQIYSMNADGSNQTLLVDDCCTAYPVYSPDGTKIAYYSLDQLVIADADGSDPLSLAFFPAFESGRPSFSPDGLRIAYPNVETPDDPESPGTGILSVPAAGGTRVLEVSKTQTEGPTSPSYSPDGASLAYSFLFAEGPVANPPYTPAGHGINISELTSGQTNLIEEIGNDFTDVDWGTVPTPTCETDPSLCPPPPPDECKVRFSRARFFVFKKKPYYRLVARYFSAEPGQVKIDFFTRNADGTKGIPLGSVSHAFTGEGRFRIRKKVSSAQLAVLRGAPDGFIAEMTLEPREGFCQMGGTINLTKLRRVKNQFVWFQPN